MLNKRRKDFYNSLTREQAKGIQSALIEWNEASVDMWLHKRHVAYSENEFFNCVQLLNNNKKEKRPYHRLLDGPEIEIVRASKGFNNRGMSPPEGLAYRMRNSH